MAVTVKHLLEQNYMARVRVACGEDRLANRVEGLTFFRDACQYGVSRNNLVLAVEEELKGRGTEELDQLAETFLNQKVSAVIVKTEAEHSDEEKRLTGVFAGHRLPLLFFSGDIFYSSLIRGIEYDLIYSQGYNMSNPYEDNCLQEMVCVERDEVSILKYAKMLGIRVTEYLCIVMLKVTDTDLMQVARTCREYLGNRAFISCRNGLVMLMLRSTREYPEAVSGLKQFVEEFAEHLQAVYRRERVILGVGHVFENQIEIRKSYHCAKTAFLAAMSTPGKPILFYDDMGIYKILYHLRNRKDLYEIRCSTVGRVREYDQKNHTEYYATIKAYIENFYSIQNTARKLYVQYNTIRYRISKIKEEFGWDLFDRDDCIYLSIGFQADDFLQEEKDY